MALGFSGVFPKRRTLQEMPDFIQLLGSGFLEFIVGPSLLRGWQDSSHTQGEGT